MSYFNYPIGRPYWESQDLLALVETQKGGNDGIEVLPNKSDVSF